MKSKTNRSYVKQPSSMLTSLVDLVTHVHAVWFWSSDRCVVFCRNRYSIRWGARHRRPRRSRSVCHRSSRRVTGDLLLPHVLVLTRAAHSLLTDSKRWKDPSEWRQHCEGVPCRRLTE